MREVSNFGGACTLPVSIVKSYNLQLIGVSQLNSPIQQESIWKKIQ